MWLGNIYSKHEGCITFVVQCMLGLYEKSHALGIKLILNNVQDLSASNMQNKGVCECVHSWNAFYFLRCVY